MVLRGGLLDVDDIHLFPCDRGGFDPQNTSLSQLGSVIFTCATFVCGVLMDIEDAFVYHSEAGHARATPACVVGSSDVILCVGTDK